jgi:hypothetical protein
LNAIPGIDFSKYPHIMAAPPLARPADFFALTKFLLVPSLFAEPFGRVAAEYSRSAVSRATREAAAYLPVQQQRYLEYFGSLGPGGRLFE